ncbi:MAG: hypothetical protein PHE61_06290 [Candidatus Omnitrophica bacterium]|nr:hypothetical protein [Candidatus Omnitrophota bacterium]
MAILTFLSIFILGLSSTIGQLVILRELAQVFYGNELSFAITLTSWLFWVAIGSGLLSKLRHKIKDKTALYFGLILAGSVILLATLAAIKTLRPILGLLPGELVSLPTMLLATFLVVAPFTIIQGFLFTVAPSLLDSCTWYRTKTFHIRYLVPDQNTRYQVPNVGTKHMSSTLVNTVYLIEAIGAFAGGLVYYFLGAGRLDPFQNLCYVNAFAISCSIAYLIVVAKRVRLAVFFDLFFVLYFLLGLSHEPYQKLTEIAYRPFKVLETRDSVYGNITAIQAEDSISFYETGVHLFSTADRLSREETVHFALLAHPNPKDILLIGGGIGSSLSEIYKYNPETVHYVELDSLLIETGIKILPAQFLAPLGKTALIHGDGRYFIEKTDKSFDCILLGLPEPYNLQINRFFTEEFFREAKAKLKPGGIISFVIASSEGYLNKEQARLIHSLKKTLENVFAHVVILPGETNIFLASDTLPLEKLNLEFFLARIEERKIDNKFVNVNFLRGRINQFAMDRLKERLAKTEGASVNKDLKPISYYYDFILWSEITSPYVKKALVKLLNMDRRLLFVTVVLIFMALFLLSPPKLKKKRALLAAVGFLGLTEISLEIIILLAFQIFYGFVYSQMILVIAAYMLGLVGGSAAGRSLSEKIPPDKKYSSLIIIQGVMIIFIALLAAVFKLSEFYGTHSAARDIFQAGFPLLTAIAGLIGGLQFPIANSLYMEPPSNPAAQEPKPDPSEKKVGTIYAYDLLGSSVGALIVSTLVVPILGIYPTLGLLAFINAGCLISLFAVRKPA